MASNSFNEAFNMRIKKINPKKLLEFEDFAGPGLVSKTLFGSFRDNVLLFLQNFSEIEDYTVDDMPVWCTLLVTKHGGAFPLFIVEETVWNSENPHCSHCKLSGDLNWMGWGHHFVCKRKYHLIIPSYEDWDKPLHGNFSQFQSHSLYSLIHCNGYGHLISINGIQDGTNFISFREVMDFWNHLCTVLRARKISFYDVSRRGPIELRLIYGAAYGHSWYSNWDYKLRDRFSGGTDQELCTAMKFLSSFDLDKIVRDFKKKKNGKEIKELINKYREMSDKPLVTIGDLLKYMLKFKSRLAVPGFKPSEFDSKDGENTTSLESFMNSMTKGDCRWSAKRLEEVLRVIVDLLNEHKTNNFDGKDGMTRHELREGARKSIGDTGLIDFVLKCIRCFQVENQIIRRTINPYGRLVEFTIHDIVQEAESMKWPIPVMNFNCRWSRDKLEHAANAIVSVLKENKGNKTMPRQELRDKAKDLIHDTGLIDFVLKSLDNSTVGNQIVYRSKNPITKSIEFSLMSVSENLEMSANLNGLLGLNLSEEVLFLYKKVLLGYSDLNSIGLTARLILDSNLFVKELPIEKEVNGFMTLTCRVFPSFDELDTELTRRLSPGEVVVVSPSITIGELKVVAQRALRDTYCVMDNLVLTQVGALKRIEDELILSCAVHPGSEVWVRGSGLDLVTSLRYEDGLKNTINDIVSY
ncbi:PHD finger protein-like [Dorcoceras hygrometricum]|uniref:PHD finger protein-like n=1 Tax=Dorcoceras hygrometricum TaxID=472368 RepID=A0A2Z7CNI4_9LAMI|nr:PHD finger protein-like [Dorcoceras hygrometricum]